MLNKALGVLPDLQARGAFLEGNSTEDAMHEFREQTDPLTTWLERGTVQGPEVEVTKKDLLLSYNAHAESHGRPSMNRTSFGLAMKRIRPDLREAQKRVNGTVQWVYMGIGLKSER